MKTMEENMKKRTNTADFAVIKKTKIDVTLECLPYVPVLRIFDFLSNNEQFNIQQVKDKL